jgi:hypothetical protein
MLDVTTGGATVFGRRRQALAMAPVVQIPTGNVDVVPRPRSAVADVPAQPVDAEGPPIGWYSIRNAAGEVITDGIPDHATASRMLGMLAARGARLPLVVHAPDGQQTGERLG